MKHRANQTPRRGLVIGCGGTLGFAWTAVALEELERALAWDARDAQALVGTSAGAEMVAILGSGRSTTQVVAALDGDPAADSLLIQHLGRHPGMHPPRPALTWPGMGVTRQAWRTRRGLYTGLAGLLPEGRGDAGWLRDLGDSLAGTNRWVQHPATWVVGLDTETGLRTAFGSADAPRATLGDAIAASWAIPGWFPPVSIDGRTYLDGGSASATSADLLIPQALDEVVIIAPMTSQGGQPGRGLSRLERALRAQMTLVVNREHAALEKAGTRVIRIEPGLPELEAMGFNFMDLRRRPATLAAARQHAQQRVDDALAAADERKLA